MLLILLVNTILCLVGFLPAVGIQLATVMGGASPGAGDLGAFIAVVGYVLPAMPILSMIGSWSAYVFNLEGLALVFVALPWVYLLVLGISVGIFFWLGNR